ncbi:MAG: hypothetical protein WC364_13280 [Eubacteriales bacterium]
MKWQVLPGRTPGKWRIVKGAFEALKEYITKQAAERAAQRRESTDAEMERWAQNVKL